MSGRPTFRIRDRIFASFGTEEPPHRAAPAVVSIPVKAPSGEPGFKGWICVEVDATTDGDEIAELAEDPFRPIAPEVRVAALDPP